MELVAVPCAVEISVVKRKLIVVTIVFFARRCSRSCDALTEPFSIAQQTHSATASSLWEKVNDLFRAILHVDVDLDSETAFQVLLLVAICSYGSYVRVPVHVLRLLLLLRVHFY